MNLIEILVVAFVGVTGGILLAVWEEHNAKKKDGHQEEYRKQDPVPFDEIP